VRRCGDESPTEIFPYHWDLVGQQPAQVVLGKNSGVANVAIWLERLGLEAGEAERERLLGLIKERSLADKVLLDESAFRDLYDQVIALRERRWCRWRRLRGRRRPRR
jgi:isopropylmalate/homocitrate/citramalate synthase